MICERCDLRIEPDEERETVLVETGSAVAPAVYIHAKPCKSAPRQTSPSGLGAMRDPWRV